MSEKREQIEAELAAATPGPWYPHFNQHGDPVVNSSPNDVAGFDRIANVSVAPDDYGRANAVLIGHAPAHIRSLIDSNDSLWSALIEAQSWIEGQRNWMYTMTVPESLRSRIREALEGTA